MTRSIATVPTGRRASGRLRPPSSKSLTHRAALLAWLARRSVAIAQPLDAGDTRRLTAALSALGARVTWEPERLLIEPGRRPRAEIALDCGEAGTLLRLLTGALAATPGRWRLDGSARLRQRPIAPLVEALRSLGASIDYAGKSGYAPLVGCGERLGGRCRVDAGESSQFLSALLLAGVAAGAPIEIEVLRLVSRPYVELTLAAIDAFGGRVEVAGDLYRVDPGLAPPAELRIEADHSSAAYPAAAAALTGGEVRLAGLDRDSRQADARFFALLARMGAVVEWMGEELVVRGGGELHALEADLGDMPDQVPTLAALAPFARGTSRLRGAAHLRLKESDRLAAMATELGRLGATVEERADGLVIEGTWAVAPPPEGAVVVDPHGDHRIAMSLALTGLRRPGVSIASPEVVEKSYPEFWRDLAELLKG